MASTSLELSGRRTDLALIEDEQLVDLARAGNEDAIRTLVRRHNQLLFRTARSVVRNDAEAEDVVQAAYVKAFTHLEGFRGEARFSTWLTRIAINEAISRLRGRKRTVDLDQIDNEAARGGAQVIQFPTSAVDPENEASRREVRAILERAVDALPVGFRQVFVLREIQGLSTEETAEELAIKPETVKTRLHRARRMLRGGIEQQLSGAFSALFPFDGARCVSMADRVVESCRKSLEAARRQHSRS